jgi:cytochrome c peroxidase
MAFAALSFSAGTREVYSSLYLNGLDSFATRQRTLEQNISQSNLRNPSEVNRIRLMISSCRMYMKQMDIWFRYLDPLAYKKINSPLPVEWETEVFEKFEKPYKREGTGLTLAELYLDEEGVDRDSLLRLIRPSLEALQVYRADSVTDRLKDYHHFYLCNRLFLLNLAAIYTTGFECPDTSRIIPELRCMLQFTTKVYEAFNVQFPHVSLSNEYLSRYRLAMEFVNREPDAYSLFDHYTFIRDYVNPLFVLNQQMIAEYRVVSRSLLDYSLNKRAASVFDKDLYRGQDTKGIFHKLDDDSVLEEIGRLGKLLFYDPLLSGNNQRACAGCHKPDQYFTDTTARTAADYARTGRLKRNTPTLINAQYNHLLMADGRHISLLHQASGVIADKDEMQSNEGEVMKKLMSCDEYRKGFERLLIYTPQEKEVTFSHISSAISIYYSRFSRFLSPFDEAMLGKTQAKPHVRKGFNLFMSRAQCAGCHFVPQFNGVKPPYVGSEFEVLGVPSDSSYTNLSPDRGRYEVNPASETLNAFRTGTIRNASRTAPYMHNGVFSDLKQLLEFYNTGGGAGHGLEVPNQTLSSDSLHLSTEDMEALIHFINSLNEQIRFEKAADRLPLSSVKKYNSRRPGGVY